MTSRGASSCTKKFGASSVNAPSADLQHTCPFIPGTYGRAALTSGLQSSQSWHSS